MNIDLLQLLEAYKHDPNQFNQKYKLDDFKLLTRVNIQPMKSFEYDNKQLIKAIFLDVETTGLNLDNEVIEIAVVPFIYHKETLEILAILEPFNEFQEPSHAIPVEITNLTGITDEMVKGHHINIDKLENIVKDAQLIISHNASFDRPFVEKISDLFSKKPWACSIQDIDWNLLGFENKALGYLCMQAGLFYQKHRATADCYAALELLKSAKDTDGKTAFHYLLISARKEKYRVQVSTEARYKDIFKDRNYLWFPKQYEWYIDVAEDDLETENKFLKNNTQFIKQQKINKICLIDRFTDRAFKG